MQEPTHPHASHATLAPPTNKATANPGGIAMLTYLTPPKAEPTGNTLVRLTEIPLADRLAALHRIMIKDSLTADEAATILDICLDPGDTSARIAT